MNELVYLKNDEAVCDSLQVAEKFGKRHDKLIAEIRRMYGELIGKRGVQNGGAKFFFESTYENRGKRYPMFLMTRDGFSLLVMGFTGKEALEWKLQYIRAFNQMENLSVRNLLKCGLKPEKRESLLEKQKPIQSRNLLSMQRDRAAAMQKCFT